MVLLSIAKYAKTCKYTENMKRIPVHEMVRNYSHEMVTIVYICAREVTIVYVH